MNKIPQWLGAQKSENCHWEGMLHYDCLVLRVLADNSAWVPVVRKYFPTKAETSVEIGIGPYGLGISAFLPEIPVRLGVEPLPQIAMESSAELAWGSLALRKYVHELCGPIRYVQGCGEELPIWSGSADLVMCCNVLDHASDPTAILREIHCLLKPQGLFFF